MYVAKLEAQTNIYLNTTAKLVPEKIPFSIETKSSGISGRFY